MISSFFKGNERSVTVKKNILGSLAVKGFSILISLMLVPMTLGYVNSELYGIWLMLSSIMVWLSFFDIGFTLGLKNKLAESIALGDWNRGKSLVSTTYFIMVLIFVPLCIIIELVVPFINWSTFLNINIQYNDEVTRTVHVLVLFFCLQMIVNVLTSVISAFQKVALAAIFPVIGNVVSLLVIWLLTKFCAPSLIALAFAISAMPIIFLIFATFILFNSTFSQVRPSFKHIKKCYINDVFSLGARFFLIQIQVLILYQSTNILISNVSGPEDVTAYNIAYKYMSVAMMIFTIILSPLWPAFTDAYTKKDFYWMRSVYKKISQIFFISCIGLAIMVCISPFAYSIWIGDKANIPIAMTIAVCIYMVIYNWDSLQVNLINGVGSIKLQTYVTLIGIVLHIPLSLFLGVVCRLGTIGVIISMIVINTIYASFFTIQINKIINKNAFGIWIK